jgi:hypothetical protein
MRRYKRPSDISGETPTVEKRGEQPGVVELLAFGLLA